MTHINDLPFEIMSAIFRLCIHKQEDRTLGYRSMFPRNAATTCTFWLDVLKSMPNCWQKIYFDLVDDHSYYLLDTLHLPSDDPREVPSNGVYVLTQNQFSFAYDALERGERRNLENKRAKEIFARLLPHLARYSIIHFDVQYQSSLPSCADILRLHLPHLRKVVFRCQVYDLDDRDPELSCISPPLPRTDDGGSHGHLLALNLPGLSFIELAQFGEEWIAQYLLSAGHLVIEISHFRFRTHAAINAFLALFAMRGGGDHNTFILRDLSLVDGFDASTSEAQHIIVSRPEHSTNKLRFEGVSQQVISLVLSSVRFPVVPLQRSRLEEIAFDDCIIPPIPDVARTKRVDHLHVRACRGPPRDADAQLAGLKGAISAFAPRNVVIYNFLLTEDFVDWVRESAAMEGMTVNMQNCDCVITQANGEELVVPV